MRRHNHRRCDREPDACSRYARRHASERTDLLTGERVVMESTGGLLTLTNCRVRLDGTGAGVARYLTITLDAVASAGVVIRSHPMLLAMALISIVRPLDERDVLAHAARRTYRRLGMFR